MAIAQVQTNKANTTGANAAATFSSGCVAGNLIVATVRFAGLALSAVTDPAGFARDGGKDNAGAAPCAIVASKIAAGGETTITFTNVSTAWELEISEWSGNDPVPLDAVGAGNSGSSVTSLTPGSVTPLVANDLVIGVITQNNTNGGGETAPGGWNLMDAATFSFSEHFYKIKSGGDTSAENPSIGWTTARNAYGIIVAYRELQVVAGGQPTIKRYSHIPHSLGAHATGRRF